MTLARTRIPTSAPVAALVVLLAGSCGPGNSTPTTVQPPPPPKVVKTEKVVKPFETKADSKPHYQALILGTTAKGGSTIIPLVGSNTTTMVDALWVRTGIPGIETVGGSSKVWLTTSPQSDGKVRVGMYESYAGGMGQQWRAAVWMAAFLTSTVLGKDLTDFKFTAENDGMIDGASAGALMTAGFLAALTGAEIDTTATMTGTINPDGTVGPVAGIPHKFQAAIDSGKKRLGYPVGLQWDHDINLGKKVDLVALAAANGAEAVEISDVYEAYTFLTGKKLPVPVPVPVSEMVVEPAVEKKLTAYYDNWRAFLDEEWARIVTRHNEGRLPAGLRSLALIAEREATQAEKYLQQGLPTSAYQRLTSAVVFAATATATWEVVEQVKKGDIAAAKARLFEFQSLAGQTDEAMREVGKLKPRTISDTLLMVSAFQLAIAGWGFHQFGSEQMAPALTALDKLSAIPVETLANDAAITEQVIRDVIPPIIAIARGIASTKVALEALDIEKLESRNYKCSMLNAKRFSESYASAAAANLKYFEALFVKGLANHLKIPDDQAKIIIMQQNQDYLVAFMAFQLGRLPIGLPAVLRDEWGVRSRAWVFSKLAGGILSYFKTSLLIAKRYSLQVETNPYTGEPVKVAHQKAFINMITIAERKAREHAHSAKLATGSIPLQSRLHYQNARVLREGGNLADQLHALELYWASSVYSQTAVMLARN
jgi:uncharacterized protein